MDGFTDIQKRPASSYLTPTQEQEAIHAAVREREDQRSNAALTSVIAVIDQFLDLAGHREGFFNRSTRDKTAAQIKGILESISKQNTETENKNYHAALVLHFFHFAIGSNNSALREHLEKGLATLLNCEAEYLHIIANNSQLSDRFTKCNALFRLQLHLRGHAPQNELGMYRYAKQITNIDSSWFYKFGSEKYKQNKDMVRGNLFEYLRNEMSQSIGVRSVLRPQ